MRSVSVKRAAGLGLAGLILLLGASLWAGPAAAQELTNGQVVEVSLGSGDSGDYYIDVPAGSTLLRVNLDVTAGAAELYTKYDAEPTAGDNDCHSNEGDGTEECSHTNPTAGRWYIKVVASAADTTADLTATFAPTAELTSGTGTAIHVDQDASAYYYIDVPAGSGTLTVNLSVSSGTAVLYTRQGSQPTQATYDCTSDDGDSPQQCVHNTSAAGRWYIMVYGTTETSATLTATYAQSGGSGGTSAYGLTNNVAVSVSVAAEESRNYFINVPANATGLTFTLALTSGTAALYTNYQYLATIHNADCTRSGSGTLVCSHTNPATGRWYAMVRGTTAAQGTLTAAYTLGASSTTSGGSLTNNRWVAGSVTQGGEANYSLTVPQGRNLFKVDLRILSGSPALYVKLGSAPTTSSYDCVSAGSTGHLSCRLLRPEAGTYYIMVHGNQASRFALKALYAPVRGRGQGTVRRPPARWRWTPTSRWRNNNRGQNNTGSSSN